MLLSLFETLSGSGGDYEVVDHDLFAEAFSIASTVLFVLRLTIILIIIIIDMSNGTKVSVTIISGAWNVLFSF